MPARRNGNGITNLQKAASNAAVPLFDAEAFLNSAGAGRVTSNYKPNRVIFRQGDPADAVFYIREGEVKLAVLLDLGQVGKP